MHLTDLSIKRLRVPEKGQCTYVDEAVPGFGVRVSAGGSKAFVLVYGRARRRVTIGRYPTIILADARAKARELLAQRILGKEDLPLIKFEDAVPIFLASHYPEGSLKQSTQKETKRILNRHFLPPLRYENLTSITTHDIMRIIDRMRATPSMARHAFCIIRLFFNWAERRRYVHKSPCWGLDRPRAAPPRDRVLTKDEIKTVLTAARKHTGTLSTIIELLLLTGQRRGEIANLRAEWIDWNNRTITLPAKVTKNRREHTIPFGDRVEELLKRGKTKNYLFPGRGVETPFDGWSKCKPKFDKLSPLPAWTLHDLRRTFATNLAALGVSVPVTEKLLNHVSGSTGGIVAVYQRHTYAKEMREAMNLWESFIEEFMRSSGSAGERMDREPLKDVA